MIVGLPGFGLGTMFYAVLLLGMGAKTLWGWVRQAGRELAARGGAGPVQRPPVGPPLGW